MKRINKLKKLGIKVWFFCRKFDGARDHTIKQNNSFKTTDSEFSQFFRLLEEVQDPEMFFFVQNT